MSVRHCTGKMRERHANLSRTMGKQGDLTCLVCISSHDVTCVISLMWSELCNIFSKDEAGKCYCDLINVQRFFLNDINMIYLALLS